MGDIRSILEELHLYQHLLENDGVLYADSTECCLQAMWFNVLSSDPSSSIVLYLVISVAYRLPSDPS
jgi:hypothetical protein